MLHMFRQVLFGAGNQGNHQNFKKCLLSYKCGLIFIGMKQKKIYFQFSIFFHENFMVLRLMELIDAKGINVAQPIWL